jgi:hypothetical protein
MNKVIRSLNSKSSSSFDKVSNLMVKSIPGKFCPTLVESYNALFGSATWGTEWKQARTVCFNKVDKAAPTPNQLRPISLFPVLTKIYERLFLLRFNTWIEKNEHLTLSTIRIASTSINNITSELFT